MWKCIHLASTASAFGIGNCVSFFLVQNICTETNKLKIALPARDCYHLMTFSDIYHNIHLSKFELQTCAACSTLAISWESNGKHMGISWEYQKNLMGITRVGQKWKKISYDFFLMVDVINLYINNNFLNFHAIWWWSSTPQNIQRKICKRSVLALISHTLV